MQDLSMLEVDDIGGVLILLPLAPIAVELAAGALAAGAAAFVSFTYLRTTADHKH